MNNREKEINQVASFYQLSNSQEKFVEGAKWADQHPREGLWDANKVLAWISQNIESYCKLNAKNFNNLLFDLRKAMEE